MFGKGKKRTALIKELAEQRFVMRGAGSVESRLKIKSLGSMAAMSLPEATIVIILEGIVNAQKRGIPLHLELERVERQRSRNGSDPIRFFEVVTKSISDNPAEAAVDYLYYRNQVESPPNGQLSRDEVAEMVSVAYMEIQNW